MPAAELEGPASYREGTEPPRWSIKAAPTRSVTDTIERVQRDLPRSGSPACKTPRQLKGFGPESLLDTPYIAVPRIEVRGIRMPIPRVDSIPVVAEVLDCSPWYLYQRPRVDDASRSIPATGSASSRAAGSSRFP